MTNSSTSIESAAQPDAANTTAPATASGEMMPVASQCCSAGPTIAAESCHSATAPQASDGEPVMIEESSMLDALRNVIDPELMINIVDLGLVYAIRQPEHGVVNVDMTLTSPACPAGPQIVSQSRISLEKIPGMKTVEIKLVMSPPWSPDRMTDEARDQLGIF